MVKEKLKDLPLTELIIRFFENLEKLRPFMNKLDDLKEYLIGIQAKLYLEMKRRSGKLEAESNE